MKTIWGLLIFISISILFFFGIQDVSEKAILNNPDLTTESLNKISKYNKNLENLTEYQKLRIDTSLSSNETNEIEQFYREAAENKNTIEKLRDGIEFVYDIPTFFLLAIPFIELTDLALDMYKGVIWFLLSVIVILALYKAVRTGQTDD